MTEKEKRELIDKIVEYGEIKQYIGGVESVCLSNNETLNEDVRKTLIDKRDTLLSNIIDVIKKL